MPASVNDPVRQVVRRSSIDRPARLVRRFRHGVGGTSLVNIDGRPAVMKAWPADTGPDIRAALTRMSIMRRRDVPIPAVLEHGAIDGFAYLLYEYVDGHCPRRVTSALLADLIQVVDAERAVAPTPQPCWQATLLGWLTDGDPLFDIAPDIVADHPTGRVFLRKARERLDRCPHLPGGDIVHGDFAPENVLVRDGRLVGVVDWERSRAGDAGLDLVGALFDIEIAGKAAPTVLRRLWIEIEDRIAPDVLALYVAVYAVRYASWAIGTEMEAEVLALDSRLIRATD